MADNPGDPVFQNSSGNQSPIIPDWTLFISSHQSPEHHHWSRDQSAVVWTMVFFWDDYVNLQNNCPIFNLLGYPQKQASGALLRVLPMQHPTFQWLRATDLSVEFVIPNGKLDSSLGGGGGPAGTSYEHVRVSSEMFSSVNNYDIYSETELSMLGLNEWDRYVVKIPSPINDIFQAVPERLRVGQREWCRLDRCIVDPARIPGRQDAMGVDVDWTCRTTT